MRFPAVFCGIFGFKPTQNRLSKKGNRCARKNEFNQFNYLLGTAGPMGKTAEDLVIASKITFDQNAHLLDPIITPSPWNDGYF